MQMTIAALLLAQTLATAAPMPPAADALASPATAPAAPALTDEVIKKAVRETIAEDPHPQSVAIQDDVLRADTAHARMSAAFDDAKVPDCLHPDALKLQPATIGPIAVVGPYALPWLISAAVRGKCR